MLLFRCHRYSCSSGSNDIKHSAFSNVRFVCNRIGLVVFLANCCNPVFAQITPSQSLQQQLREDSQKEKLERLEDLERKQQNPSINPITEEEMGNIDFYLEGIRVEGVLPENILGVESLLSKWIGLKVDNTGLRKIRAEILQWYASQDQLVAVQFPVQNLANGILEIRILESLLGGVRVNQDLKHYLKDSVALSYVTSAVPLGKVIRPGKLESAVLKLNDLAGVEVRAQLESGALPGTTDVVLDIRDGDRHNVVVDVSNYLNRFSGSLRTSAEFNASNFDGRGGRVWVRPSWWGNAQGTGTAPISAGVDIPIGSNGLKASLNANYGTYRVLDELYEDDINGTTFASDISFTQPLWRRPDRSVFLSLSGGYYGFDDYIGDIEIDEKKAGVGRLSVVGISRDQFMGIGINTLIAGVSVGSVDLSGNSNFQAFDDLTAQVQGEYAKFNWLYRREQQFDSRWGMRIMASGQFASENLDGFEQCGLGWPNGVRAYTPGEASSSHCVVGQLDVSYQLKSWLKLVGFADAGWGQRWVNPFPGALSPNNYGLFGAGVGFDLPLSQNMLINVRVAFPIGENNLYGNGLDVDGYDPPGRIWAGLKVLL